ncbi:MAG: SBBP repeat-containing protein [Acidobacteriia bacterium]|nr:SBBP repeat-containing protein [Terriglobia bacterium]
MTRKKTGNGMKAAFLAGAVLATAGVASYFAGGVHAAKAGAPSPAAHRTLASKTLSLPLFFEPNQGQTAPQVRFLSRGAGYGLFLTADEAVLELQPSAVSHQPSASNLKSKASSVIRMRLEGANSAARVSGASPLPGKSSYFIGNDPAKWHRDIPQFGRVQYQAVYPGVDLVYYGDQGQLEYDFRVAPAADPNQIALRFQGAATHIDSGDLVLSTSNGDVRFRAPHIYQQDGERQRAVAGSFRQLADNKIGFTVGDYDHSHELVIDPILTYSTFLGGGGTEGRVKVAVDSGGLIYLAGSTNSADFPVTDGSTLNGSQSIFISKINPSPQSGASQLVYSIYLGGEQTDSLSGIAVDAHFNIYVAGFTNSTLFPTTSNAFQTAAAVAGTHGFLSRISFNSQTLGYALSYSTYLAGDGTDHVTGLAIDSSNQNAYVTGDTTSSNPASAGFPANPNGYQIASNSPGFPQFFASKINTTGSGPLSMLYSTYFGGGNPVGATAVGGGIAVDPSGSNVNMYITGTTNMLPTLGPNGEARFPLFSAQQSCLNEASQTACTGVNGITNTDAFVAKINPNQPASNPVYSTYLGGGGTDASLAVAVDTSSNVYVTGSTNSGDWAHCNGYQCVYSGAGGASNAFIAKIGNLVGSVYPLNYFTYLGGSGPDSGQDIKVDALQAAHMVGSTASPNLPLTTDAIQTYQGQGDAFVALIETNVLQSLTVGNYVTYLGGNQLDQGTGIALDTFNATYVAGNTLSPNFPTVNPYQPQLNGGSQDAFVSKIGAVSQLQLTQPTTSPSPSPVAAGTQAAFTFDIINVGPDNASNVIFLATVPTTGLASPAQAKVTSGTGTCTAVQGTTIVCNIPTLAACTGSCIIGAAVEVDVTPAITATNQTISVSGSVGANGGASQVSLSQIDNVVDFKMSSSTSTPTINAGDTATIQANFCPTNPTLGYSATITPSQTTSPSMATQTTPVFSPTPVTLSGSACASTTLSIATVARPVTTGSLLRRNSFYATWLPIGGLSLVGLGLGASRRRRRWLVGAVLSAIAGAVLLQAGCGSSSSSVSPTGGTAAGTYTITINGSAGTGASHSTQVTLHVN